MNRVTKTQSLPMIFNSLFNRDMFNEGNLSFFDCNSNMPAVNIKETTTAFHIEVAAPGRAKEDFKIELDGDGLTLSAESRQQSSDEDHGYHMREFSSSAFRRNFTLPKEIADTDKITAAYTNGVLIVDIPKKETALPKPSRTIEIA